MASSGEDSAAPRVVAVTALTDRFDAFAREHRPFLEGLARKLCKGRFDPDDLVQDAMERALRHFDALPGDVNERAWLARIMHNLFIDRVRRRGKAVHLSLDEAQLAQPEAAAEREWERVTVEQVAACVERLPADLREVYRLHASLNLSYAEIAERLAIPMGTVGTRLLRARRALRALLLGSKEER
jgi:RNA polymerase sigma-70 factor (ECF subfamily)